MQTELKYLLLGCCSGLSLMTTLTCSSRLILLMVVFMPITNFDYQKRQQQHNNSNTALKQYQIEQQQTQQTLTDEQKSSPQPGITCFSFIARQSIQLIPFKWMADIFISMNYYLIGKSIENSLSPRIHNYLFQLKTTTHKYQPPLSNRLFSIPEMRHPHFGGISITIPFKKHYAYQMQLKLQGEVAVKHNIINTIYKDESRQLRATNTDIYGIEKCFGDSLRKLQHNNALIIGAGATAEIFCSYFEQHQYKVSFLNRSIDKQHIKKNFNNLIDLLPLRPSFEHVKKAQVYSTIVNTLPSEVVYENWDLIEANLVNLLQFYAKNTRSKVIYMNVNYREKLDPIEQFLKGSFRLSISTLKGIDMLLWQAIEQNRHFCNQKQQDNEYTSWLYAKLKNELHL